MQGLGRSKSAAASGLVRGRAMLTSFSPLLSFGRFLVEHGAAFIHGCDDVGENLAFSACPHSALLDALLH
jgi:hypothetical protein